MEANSKLVLVLSAIALLTVGVPSVYAQDLTLFGHVMMEELIISISSAIPFGGLAKMIPIVLALQMLQGVPLMEI
jgi:hypothetical protein